MNSRRGRHARSHCSRYNSDENSDSAIVRESHRAPDRWPELILKVTQDQILDDPSFAFEIAVQLCSGIQICTPNNVEYVRIGADRLIDVGERAVEIAIAMQGDPTIDVGAGKARIDLDSLIEVGNRSS